MYCIKCGVELADSEKVCPLCHTPVFHPQLSQKEVPLPYPTDQKRAYQTVSHSGALFILTALTALSVVVLLLCDWSINQKIVWSGYAVGGILLLYFVAAFPRWFRNPNPIIFVPVGFAVALLYLLYIDLQTGGKWFLSFAFPVCGGLGLIVTAVVTLSCLLHRGYLFIYGGAMIAGGAFALLIEFLLNLTFHFPMRFVWSFYPLAAGVILGLTLIIIGISRPLRESLQKKFFL